jgi:iron complex outermembrane receptor protein
MAPGAALLLLAGIVVCLPATPGLGAVPAANLQLTSQEDLTELPLEALMDLEVTLASRKPQRLANTAAAAFIISQEDIRRSGATSIPELLRMVPGVQVAKIDANKWAVSIRGINGRFVSKLQVLKDGRSVYTPLFSGVFWESLDTPLEDIERIEVIRGPGAAMWGANAVNGVINIITKHAVDTQGGLLSGGGGSSEKGFGTARLGKQLTDNSYLRLYGKHVERGEGKYANGSNAHDDWHLSSGGFRFDTQPTFDDAVTVQGDYHNGRYHETYSLFSPLGIPYQQDTTSTSSGGNLLARWQRTLSDSDEFSVQLSFDHSNRELYFLGEHRSTFDADFQHHFSLGSYQKLLWGLGYRYSYDRTTATSLAHLTKDSEGLNLYSIFLQDEITLLPDALSLILGSRFEHNDYTGWEIQPNGRLLWTPSPQHSFWGSVSRAVRTPTRAERHLNYTLATLPGPVNVEVNGSDNFRSETVLAYELGYRAELSKRLTFDLSLFYNQYNKLRVSQTPTLDMTTLPPTMRMTLGNDAHGHAHGVELSANWRPYDWLRLQTAYHYLQSTIKLDNGSSDNDNRSNTADGAPRHQLTLRSGVDLTKQLELDLWLRAVDHVDYINRERIPGYVTLDARIAWKPLKNLELALVGQNLLQDHHPEYKPEFIDTVRSEVPRSVYGKVTLQFQCDCDT